MRSVFIHINIFIICIIFSYRKVGALISFTYPSAISLMNGNFFIVEQNGIFVYDEQLTNIIRNYSFKEEDKIANLDSLSNVIILYKRNYQNYIICLINGKIYFFDYEGKLLKETEKIITDENYYHPTLTPIKLDDDYNSYYYIVGYYTYESSSYKIKLLYYKINLSDYSNNYITSFSLVEFTSSFWKDKYHFEGQGLSCEYLNAENYDQDTFLTCFFIINIDNKMALSHNFFGVTDSELSINKKYYYDYIKNLNAVKQLKVVATNNRKNALVCLLFTDQNLDCYKFRYTDGLLTDSASFYQSLSTNFNCRNELYGMKLNSRKM